MDHSPELQPTLDEVLVAQMFRNRVCKDIDKVGPRLLEILETSVELLYPCDEPDVSRDSVPWLRHFAEIVDRLTARGTADVPMGSLQSGDGRSNYVIQAVERYGETHEEAETEMWKRSLTRVVNLVSKQADDYGTRWQMTAILGSLMAVDASH